MELFQSELSRLEPFQLELLSAGSFLGEGSHADWFQPEALLSESLLPELFLSTRAGAVLCLSSLAMAGAATIVKAASASIAASNTIFLKSFSL